MSRQSLYGDFIVRNLSNTLRTKECLEGRQSGCKVALISVKGWANIFENRAITKKVLLLAKVVGF
jgi:hypothetical protein